MPRLRHACSIYRARQIRQGFAEWPCFGVMKYAELRKARIFTSAELATLRSAFARFAATARQPSPEGERARLPSRSSRECQASEGWLLGLDSNQQPSG